MRRSCSGCRLNFALARLRVYETNVDHKVAAILFLLELCCTVLYCTSDVVDTVSFVGGLVGGFDGGAGCWMIICFSREREDEREQVSNIDSIVRVSGSVESQRKRWRSN